MSLDNILNELPEDFSLHPEESANWKAYENDLRPGGRLELMRGYVAYNNGRYRANALTEEKLREIIEGRNYQGPTLIAPANPEKDKQKSNYNLE